jgi:phenylalanyl-tRNA synthetase alpha chain
MSNLKIEIESIENSFKKALKSIDSLDQLETLRVNYLGRKGKIAALMPQLKTLSLEEKREIGPQINALKITTENLFEEKKEDLFDKNLEEQEASFKDFDITAYKPNQPQGSLHLYTQATQEIISIFASMGYSVESGPEAETEFYNFEALNIPGDHPARDMQDTFWTTLPQTVLRTHTSPVQIRTMEAKKPPLKIIVPGRVYRHEATDASHDFQFHQFEGMVIDKDISLSNMIATMKLFLETFFKKELKVRSRPGYFPFVEPGIEIDMSCPFCTDGCSTCKKTKWIEMVGAGLIHPNVLKAGGIDTKKYTGFAFGFGLTRLVMIKYGINDIRHLHNAHVEFLKQF